MDLQQFLAEYPFLSLTLGFVLTCCSWCFLAHCLFLPFCTCLKRRHKLDQFQLITDNSQPFTILAAHRGGAAERMENTLPAFHNAVAQGMNLLECDVHMSKDGHVASTERTGRFLEAKC